MAYPVIETLSYGSLNTENTHTHTVPLPSGLEVGNIVVIFISITSPGSYACIAVPTSNSTSNFSTIDAVNGASTGNWSNGTRIYMPRVPKWHWDASLTCIVAQAYATNTLEIVSAMCKWDNMPSANWVSGDYVKLYSKPAYVCYRISGAYVPLLGSFIDSVVAHQTKSLALESTSNWNLPAIPNTDDSDYEDYLWLLGVASPTNMVAAFAPSGFTMIQNIHAINGSSSIPYSSSISTCYKQDNSVSRLDPGTFTANSCDFAGIGIRIRPSAGSEPTPLPTQSGGIGMYVYKKDTKTYQATPGAIEVLPETMDFDFEGTECDNPFNTYIQIVALSSWTAWWTTGTYFEASSYSGGEGVSYIAITCKGENSTGDSYTDTLTLQCESTYDYVAVEQYANGIYCS